MKAPINDAASVGDTLVVRHKLIKIKFPRMLITI